MMLPIYAGSPSPSKPAAMGINFHHWVADLFFFCLKPGVGNVFWYKFENNQFILLSVSVEILFSYRRRRALEK